MRHEKVIQRENGDLVKLITMVGHRKRLFRAWLWDRAICFGQACRL